MDYDTQVAKPPVVTYGMEIEQRESVIKGLLNVLDKQNNPKSPMHWHQDGSGPMETDTPAAGSKAGIMKVIKFIHDNNYRWEWVNEYLARGSEYTSSFADRCGCGSHLHFRLIEANIPAQDRLEAWACMWNTILETSLIMIPCFAFGSKERNEFCFRKAAPYNTSNHVGWARMELNKRVVTKSMHSTSEKPWIDDIINERVDIGAHRGWMSSSMSESDGKPFTIELRANESHPTITIVTAQILQRVVRDCIDRGYKSPVFIDRNFVQNEINKIYQNSAFNTENIYDLMHYTSSIKFKTPIPRLKSEYNNLWLCFKDLITKYTNTGDPHSRRIEEMWKAQYKPYLVADDFWDVPFVGKGAFTWTYGEYKSPFDGETVVRQINEPVTNTPTQQQTTPKFEGFPLECPICGSNFNSMVILPSDNQMNAQNAKICNHYHKITEKPYIRSSASFNCPRCGNIYSSLVYDTNSNLCMCNACHNYYNYYRLYDSFNRQDINTIKSSNEPQRCPKGHFNTENTLRPGKRYCNTCGEEYNVS